MEIVQERLRREFDLDIIASYPNVIYRINLKNGETMEVDNPTMLPDIMQIESMEEPFIKATIITPTECMGDMMQLIMEKRGEIVHTGLH